MHARRGRGGFVERRDQVLQAQFRRVHVELTREGVHDALVGVGRLGAPGAAVGVGRA